MKKDQYFRTYANPSGGVVLYHVWAFNLGDDGMDRIGVYETFEEADKIAMDLGLEEIPMYIKNQMDNG
jgi:hypothetical protein